MAVGLNAAGSLGIAREVTPGTYVAPEKFVPILSESLEYTHGVIKRRPIRGLVDVVGAVVGPQHVEGSIQFEITHDILPYFLYGMRGDVVKSGAPSDYTYTFTPNAGAQAVKHLSFTVVRNAIRFGYLGCVIGGLQVTMQNEIMVATVNVVGLKEVTQADPTEVWPTTAPVGIPGDMKIEIPTATPVTDADNFTLDINDNAEPQFRLRDDQVTPTFIKFGEREITLSMERDFESRADFDLFKGVTSQAITISGVESSVRLVQFDVEAAVKQSYGLGMSGQGDLVRGAVEYEGIWSQTDSRAYLITCKTNENIV